MMRSLYAGVSGMQNHQTRMDVLGNNISNVNTTGFKKGRVNFQDMLSQSMSGAAKPTDTRGGVNPKQVGLGMMIASIDTIHTQGSLQTTGNKFDLAIQGNGFFILKEGEKTFYTRAGAFGLDKDGMLVNPGTGLKVQGWMAQEVNGESFLRTAEDPTDIKLPMYSKDPAKATTNVDIKCNLYSEQPVTTFEDLAAMNEIQKANNSWTSSINVFDNYGRPLQLSLTYIRTGVNEWGVEASLYKYDPANPGVKIQVPADQFNVDAGGAVATDGQNRFSLLFNNAGRIRGVRDLAGDQLVGTEAQPNMPLSLTFNMIVPDSDPNLPNQRMSFNINLGEAEKVMTEDSIGVTQFGTGFSTKFFRQDGYTMGYLEDVKVDDSGSITGVYSNGNSRTLAQLALANFSNPGGLEKAGETNFVASNNSGLADVGTAATVGKGKIIAGTLEMSNVDLSEQFVDMIVTQRGFQANSKTIQTSDQMLQDILSLKR